MKKTFSFANTKICTLYYKVFDYCTVDFGRVIFAHVLRRINLVFALGQNNTTGQRNGNGQNLRF